MSNKLFSFTACTDPFQLNPKYFYFLFPIRKRYTSVSVITKNIHRKAMIKRLRDYCRALSTARYFPFHVLKINFEWHFFMNWFYIHNDNNVFYFYLDTLLVLPLLVLRRTRTRITNLLKNWDVLGESNCDSR